MNEQKGEFVRVSHERDQQKLRGALVSGMLDILCHCSDKRRVVFRGLSIVKDELIVEIDRGEIPITLGQVVISFSIQNEQYLFKSTLRERDDRRYSLDVSKGFFRLQRRKDFRVDIPISRNLNLLIQKGGAKKGDPFDLDFDFEGKKGSIKRIHPILDLSRGGLSFQIINPKFDFLSGEPLEGLVMQGQDGVLFPVMGEVRLVMKEEIDGQEATKVGLMFKEVPEKQVMSLVMEIYRDRFSRYGALE